MSAWRFINRARLVDVGDVLDGDTVKLEIDLGLDVHAGRSLRVRNLWCPELRDEGGSEALEAARTWFLDAERDAGLMWWPLLVEFHKTRYDNYRRSFVRYVVDIYDNKLNSFAEHMIANGHGTRERNS